MYPKPYSIYLNGTRRQAPESLESFKMGASFPHLIMIPGWRREEEIKRCSSCRELHCPQQRCQGLYLFEPETLQDEGVWGKGLLVKAFVSEPCRILLSTASTAKGYMLRQRVQRGDGGEPGPGKAVHGLQAVAGCLFG